MILESLPGQSYPLGATVSPEGVNFCVFSKNAKALELLLFENSEAATPAHIIQLDAKRNKTFYYWHIFIPGLGSGQIYAYRVYGPMAPDQGYRFDGNKVLIDPYARAVVSQHYSREAAILPGDNMARSLRCVVVDPAGYDWEGVQPPDIPYADTVIYELHVGGFTRHPSSGVAVERRGTYRGLIEKIPYLKALGITAVELLPVQQFDSQSVRPAQYWGYSPIALFAPHRGYSSRQDPLSPVDEFRDMVKALHRNSIEVILDVVFNHTDEGDETGPTLSFRGFENPAYYILSENRAQYANYSGCGNTLKGNHSIVRRLIVDCLRYWVKEMHVDGFRFDLAAILSRDEDGQLMRDPPILWSIDSDPMLAGTKIIAEAWDAAGLYQVSSFIGDRFALWNGPFRDDIRRFVKGEPHTVGPLAARLLGSPDIFPGGDRNPNRSINFVTCHDGFTLNDVVSYNNKHNEANGEANRDGSEDNLSWNCGEEGPTDTLEVNALRQRQIKNFLAILLISQGTPMLLMGDEVRRSQQGNSNAYCQNNELSWFDWRQSEQQRDLLHFLQGLVQLTQTLKIFCQETMLNVAPDAQAPHITWHGVRLGQPDWSADSHSLAFSLKHPDCGEHLYAILNAYWEPLTFELPPLVGTTYWHCLVDTALPGPEDFSLLAAPLVQSEIYPAAARSLVLLIAQ